jgi:hypothetical protein
MRINKLEQLFKIELKKFKSGRLDVVDYRNRLTKARKWLIIINNYLVSFKLVVDKFKDLIMY